MSETNNTTKVAYVIVIIVIAIIIMIIQITRTKTSDYLRPYYSKNLSTSTNIVAGMYSDSVLSPEDLIDHVHLYRNRKYDENESKKENELIEKIKEKNVIVNMDKLLEVFTERLLVSPLTTYMSTHISEFNKLQTLKQVIFLNMEKVLSIIKEKNYNEVVFSDVGSYPIFELLCIYYISQKVNKKITYHIVDKTLIEKFCECVKFPQLDNNCVLKYYRGDVEQVVFTSGKCCSIAFQPGIVRRINGKDTYLFYNFFSSSFNVWTLLQQQDYTYYKKLEEFAQKEFTFLKDISKDTDEDTVKNIITNSIPYYYLTEDSYPEDKKSERIYFDEHLFKLFISPYQLLLVQ
jgi:hypothetical protein